MIITVTFIHHIFFVHIYKSIIIYFHSHFYVIFMFCIHILCHSHILHSHIMHIFCSHLYVILIISANITSHIYSCGTASHIIIFILFIKIEFSIHFSPFIITYSYFLFSFIVLQFSRSNPVSLEFFFSFSSFIL